MAAKAKRRMHRAPAQGKKSFPLYRVLAAALVVAGGAAYFFMNSGEPAAEAAWDYSSEDVIRTRPFRAIHEMRAGPPVPYLPSGQPQPKIVIPNDFYDFGTVGAKAVVTREFVIRNEGDAPLTISRAYTTCGCTTADFSARVIPPGKAALVMLRFDAGFHDARGQNVKRGIIIENNDRASPKAEIWTRAFVSWK